MYNKEKTLAIIILTALIFSLFTIFVSSEGIPEVSARAAALYEPESEQFLYTKNENLHLPMASTTKIMTALISLERLKLDEEIMVDERAIGIDGSSIYLKSGETMAAEDLIYALMLRSANDAAEALAYEICGSIDEFCALMNERAIEIGAVDTSFQNPHGLDAKNHYTTAHDLALITATALKNEKFKEISSTYKTEIQSNLEERLLVNHNKLLKRIDGCIGVKTGYTQKSGRSLVGAAERDNLQLISVTIDAPDDWNDHEKLLEYGYSTTHATVLLDNGEFEYDMPVISGDESYVKLTNNNRVKIIYRGNYPKITKEINLNRFTVAPVHSGDVLGTITFKSNGKNLGISEIIATEDVNTIKKKSILDIFK